MNVYEESADDFSVTLQGNMFVCESTQNCLNMWSDTTLALKQAWQSETDPTLKAEVGTSAAPGTQGVDWIIANAFDPVEIWSSDEIMVLIGRITSPWDKDHSSGWLQAAQSEAQVISSELDLGTSIGGADVTTEGNMQQQNGSANQPIADAGNSLTGLEQAASGGQSQIVG